MFDGFNGFGFEWVTVLVGLGLDGWRFWWVWVWMLKILVEGFQICGLIFSVKVGTYGSFLLLLFWDIKDLLLGLVSLALHGKIVWFLAKRLIPNQIMLFSQIFLPYLWKSQTPTYGWLKLMVLRVKSSFYLWY